MGLGKTIQVLAALLRKKQEIPGSPPSLLVVPASLIGNWQREAAQFAPTLRLHIAHRSPGDTEKPSAATLAAADLVINPGLLGSSGQFATFVKQITRDNSAHFAPLRRLVSPYILRRLKTDKSTISDPPERTEMKVFCGLAPAQAQLYHPLRPLLIRQIRGTEDFLPVNIVLQRLEGSCGMIGWFIGFAG